MTTSATTRIVDGVAIPEPGTFTIDNAHSTVGFVARHLMVSKVRGSFTSVSGTITVAEQPLASSAEVTINAASFTTGAPDRDAHVLSPDFLDVEKYPTLTFVSRSVKSRSGGGFVVVGDLTIRGVTREVELQVEYDGAANSPWGQEVIAFTASTEIDREDWGISWNQALEAGGVLVSRKVKIEISVEAVRSA